MLNHSRHSQESTSMADLFAAAGDAEIGEIAEEVSEAGSAR